ncbi:MBL fold metallo-hydrolase [Amycolatopsis sp. NPDC051903]|uniref:MBL fold metallo-hydrolase n=1 Tax=Amycolatopsis sp. NPDC051903 TaxID=3363936 RepID=UPI0037AABE20
MAQTLRLGAVTVTPVFEFATPSRPPEVMFPDLDRAVWRAHESWLAPDFWDPGTGLLQTRVQTWVLRSGGETVLVDTGAGNGKARPEMPVFDHLDTDFLARLRAAGVAPDDVTTVVNTHLHADHVGWNTVLDGGEWVPAFPNARYLVSRADHDFWNPATGSPTRLGAGNDGVFEDSVAPVARAGNLVLWEDSFAVTAELRLEPAPGHTPGSAVLVAESGGDLGLFVGDVLHHPIQLVAPDLNSCFCEDPASARATRRRLLDRAADATALVFPAHLGGGLAVEVRRSGSAFSVARWGFEA